ncbi:endocellulase [Marasmius fiardii PR-910]|nr:endocellulase [Marasmius fiardii PR-910]
MLLSLSLLLLTVFSAGQTITGPTECLQAGNYQLCQNLWGRDSGVGSQNSTLLFQLDNNLSWSTTWNWTDGPNSPKSFANVESQVAKGVQLQNIASVPTAWAWSYQSKSNPIRANVAYNIWLGAEPVGAPASVNSSYGIMIWLSNIGHGELNGTPAAVNISLAGHTWDFYAATLGSARTWQSFEFVNKDGDIPVFNADLNVFFEYLVANQGVAPTQYINAIQAGNEAFTGSAVLVTSDYSVTVNPK